MSMITINESNMEFGPFDEDTVFHIEKEDAYVGLGANIKTVEFVLLQKDDKVVFFEAKSSSPRIDGDPEKFETFVNEICEKFIHSFNLMLSIGLERQNEKFRNQFKDINYTDAVFRFILVINGHKSEWIPPIMESFNRSLAFNYHKKIWKSKIIVLNHEDARRLGYIL